jgi:diguanylate cyclase (GGDEF)-like protein
LVNAIPEVVDCDRVGAYLWDAATGELVRSAMTHVGSGTAVQVAESRWAPTGESIIDRLLADPDPAPVFVDENNGDQNLRDLFSSLGFDATILVPLVTPSRFIGLLSVAVIEGPGRLRPTPDLLDRLSGVAAQATTALQNGQLVDQMTYQALHDQLTGLANRVQFTTELRSAVHDARESGAEVSLVYLDLDRFKPVNDDYGHEVGDALLAAVAERLRTCTRSTDVVARLVTAQGADAVTLLPDRIRSAFTAPFEIDALRIELGASVGRAAYPADAEDAESLLRVADAAMFVAKRSRRTSPARLSAPGVAA